MENTINSEAKELQREKALAKLDKFSKVVTSDEAWDIFNQIKSKYNAKTPNDIIIAFKSGQYQIDAEVVSIMKIIS